MIHTVELQNVSEPGRIVIKCRDFKVISLSLLTEAQDVFDSIQKLVCVSKLFCL
jgi:hypothetical protein